MKEVYNLKVEPYGVYYANDILVSNCDTAADAIRIALIDKSLIITQLNSNDFRPLAKSMASHQSHIERLKQKAYMR